MRGELEVRASDAERERIVDLLREHAVAGRLDSSELSDRIDRAYAARTTGELREVVVDLPAVRRRKPSRWTVAVIGEAVREGRWRVPRRTRAVAGVGEIRLDLRRAELEEHETKVTLWLGIGDAKVIVPDDVEVELGGFFLIGNKRLLERGTEPPPGAPYVKVNIFGIVGEGKVIVERHKLAD